MVFSCTTQKPLTQPETRTYPYDLMWMLRTVEYPAVCQQIFRDAWQSVKRQASSDTAGWVVVLDVDDTVLSNARYQEVLFERSEKYPYFWDEWVLRAECPPIAGAKAFIDSVRRLGPNGKIAFITNRKIHLESATRINLGAAGLWQDGDVLLCMQNRQDSKTMRRDELASGTGRCQGLGQRRILALLGDQIGDMEAPPDTIQNLESLQKHYRNHPDWGIRYFMLPNPMYGDWERGYQF